MNNESKKGFPSSGAQCECGPEMQIAIFKYAQKLGLKLGHRMEELPFRRGVHVYSSLGGVTGWNSGNSDNPVTPGEFIRMMEEEAGKPKPIMIDGKPVEFRNGYITVGCQNVNNDVVRKIVEKLIDADNLTTPQQP